MIPLSSHCSTTMPWLVSTHTAIFFRAQHGHLLAPALPTFGRVLDGKVVHHVPPAIDDDHIVMIVRPVEAPVISKSHSMLSCFAFR